MLNHLYLFEEEGVDGVVFVIRVGVEVVDGVDGVEEVEEVEEVDRVVFVVRVGVGFFSGLLVGILVCGKKILKI